MASLTECQIMLPYNVPTSKFAQWRTFPRGTLGAAGALHITDSETLDALAFADWKAGMVLIRTEFNGNERVKAAKAACEGAWKARICMSRAAPIGENCAAHPQRPPKARSVHTAQGRPAALHTRERQLPNSSTPRAYPAPYPANPASSAPLPLTRAPSHGRSGRRTRRKPHPTPYLKMAMPTLASSTLQTCKPAASAPRTPLSTPTPAPAPHCTRPASTALHTRE
ncbi:hypothetical protein B0H17DRAFT_1201438 [Mycena rosella]|uniref:Uncharacterized protein n=1 Tax=Mycena rosella TaxID=1033263 RepID=A0AAD7DG41_MYCRO|nr:hypothetical protein B0H17DRAFT_1201438 [Mycena rosella]